MIIAELSRHYQFITQPAHADLAGQFADHWGNDLIESPAPRASTVIVAYLHDGGWEEYDHCPRLTPNGNPIDFLEVPAEEWIELYDRGIDAVVELDSYAGLLASMHGAGLRRQRYGISPSWPDTPHAYRSFVDRQEDLQVQLVDELLGTDQLSRSDADLLSQLHETGSVPTEVGGHLWDNYKLLQAWDTLSLSVCATASPPGYKTINSVPVGGSTADQTLSMKPLGDQKIRITPYPFDTSPLVVSVPARTVPKGPFDSQQDAVHAYYGVDRELKEFTLIRHE